jgi:hypothetical protein
MNDVYVLRVSFDEWVASQAVVSDDDVSNVVAWIKHLMATDEVGVLELVYDRSLASLADIVC